MYRLFSTIKRNTLPKAIREQVWLKDMGNKFEGKCYISWCNNKINVFDFLVGHNIVVALLASYSSTLAVRCFEHSVNLSREWS